MTENPQQLKDEAVGDWCGFKGAAYHLTVAVWLLLTGRASEVEFYAGNDLLAHPVVPPETLQDDTSCGLRVTHAAQDEWMQVKAQEHPWTPSALLDGTLLRTFIFNALFSERRGRQWLTNLVTISPVRTDDVEVFISAPAKNADLKSKLDHIINDVHEEWCKFVRSSEPHQGPPARDKVRDLALSILGQVAQVRVLGHSFLVKDIEVSLTQRFHDTITVRKVATSLSGALLDAIERRPETLSISLGWLERATGYDLQPQDLLSTNAVEACGAQVERTHNSMWSAASCVDRTHTRSVLLQFLESDRTLFVLTGESGSGKSWFSSNFASQHLAGKIRARVPGGDLPNAKSLTDIVGAAFRRGRLARPHATEQEIWQRLTGAAKDSTRGPFVVIVDDLPPSSNPAEFATKLDQLCREAEQDGVKLLLVARPQVWQRLWEPTRLARHLYTRIARTDDGSDRSHKAPESYRISNLTNEETQGILERSLPEKRLSRQQMRRLREPRLAALRNAYLMSLFIRNVLRKLAPDAPLPDVDVDSLLDEEIENRLSRVAHRVGCSVAELIAARDDLVQHLWEHRTSGAAPHVLVQVLEAKLPGLGRQTLDALQLEDVLTQTQDPRSTGGNLTYTNPQLGDRLAARWLGERLERGIDILSEMIAGVDDGVMTALLRDGTSKALADAVSWGEQALERNPEWLVAIAEGVAQHTGGAWRTLAALTSWGNRDIKFSTWNAMRALGGMTGGSPLARYWGASLYSDEHPRARLKGEITLGRALEIAPRWVERRIKVRLRCELARKPSHKDKRKEVEFVRSALAPLQYLSGHDSAVIGRSVLAWLRKRSELARAGRTFDVRERLDDTLDAIRGRIALYGPPDELEAIISELGSADDEVRLRAARAITQVTAESSEAVRERVFSRSRIETNRLVLLQLLRSLHFYIGTHTDDVLAIVNLPDVRATLGNSGFVLSLIAAGARRKPREAKATMLALPDADRERAALNAELLAFAWWNYAQAASDDMDARRALEGLSTPDYTGLENKLRMFVSRSAAVATLALIGLDLPGVSEAAADAIVYFQPWALETGADVHCVDFAPVISRFAAEIARHPLAERLISLMVEALREYEKHEAHPIEVLLHSWQLGSADLCAEELAEICKQLDAPVLVVKQLPDWPALRVCCAIIDGGAIDPELVEYGLSVCSRHEREWSNVSTHRDNFYRALSCRGLLPRGRSPIQGQAFDAASDASRLDAQIANAPHDLFRLLHATVNPENAVPFLWEWSCESTNWRAVLLGHVHRACFREEPLSIDCCGALCRMLIDAAEDLPGEPFAKQNLAVFEALEHFAAGAEFVERNVAFASDFLSLSQKSALAILQAYVREQWTPTEEWFYRAVSRATGWLEDVGNWVEYGAASFGSGLGRGTVYLPPSLRVAFAIAGHRSGIGYFGSRLIRERSEVRRVLSEATPRDEVFQAIRERELNQEEKRRLRSGLEKIQLQLAKTPSHGDLWGQKGLLQLLLGELEESHASLAACLQQPFCPQSAERSARFNLACVYARLGQPDACRSELTVAISKGFPLKRKDLVADPDLASVRDQVWFQQIAETLLPE